MSRLAFEDYLRLLWKNRTDPFLRDCNDIKPDRTYQDVDTEFAWVIWQASQQSILAVLREPESVGAVARAIADSQSPAPTMGEKYPNGVPTPYKRLAQAAINAIETIINT